MKAIGFTDRGVLSLVLGESLALTLVGGSIGLGLSWLLVSMGDPTQGSLPVFYIPTRDIFLGSALDCSHGVCRRHLPGFAGAKTANRGCFEEMTDV